MANPYYNKETRQHLNNLIIELKYNLSSSRNLFQQIRSVLQFYGDGESQVRYLGAFIADTFFVVIDMVLKTLLVLEKEIADSTQIDEKST